MFIKFFARNVDWDLTMSRAILICHATQRKEDAKKTSHREAHRFISCKRSLWPLAGRRKKIDTTMNRVEGNPIDGLRSQRTASESAIEPTPLNIFTKNDFHWEIPFNQHLHCERSHRDSSSSTLKMRWRSTYDRCGQMVRTRRSPGRYITRNRNSGIVTQMRQIQFVRTMFQTDDRHRTTVLSRSCWYKQSRRKFRPHRQRPPITEDRGWPHCTPEGNVSLVVEQKEKAFIAPTRIVAWEEDGRSVRILRRRYIIPEWCWIWARSPAGRSSLAMSLGESFPAGQDWQAGKSEEKHGQNWASPFVDQRGCLHIVALRCVGKRRNFVWLSCSNCPKNVRARHVLIISRRFSEGLGHGRDGFGFSNIFQWKTLFF